MARLRISDEARDHLRDFCEHHRVSMSALAEILIFTLNRDMDLERRHEVAKAIEQARELDMERRRREPPT